MSPYKNFSDFKKRVKEDFAQTSEQEKETVGIVGKALLKESLKRSPGLKKMPLDLLNHVASWAVGFYSPAELETKLQNLEQVSVDFMVHNPKEVSHKEMEGFLGRDGKVSLTESPFDKPFDVNDWEITEDATEIQRKGKEKLKSAPVEMPSRQQLKEMPLEDLGKLVKRAKESLKDEL